MDFCYYFNGFAIEHFSAASHKSAARYIKKRYAEPVGAVVLCGLSEMAVAAMQKAKRESVNQDVLRVILE